MSLSQPTCEGCNLRCLQLNLEGGQLFCLTEVRFPHEWPGYCHQHLFSLEVVAVLMLINPCHALSDTIVDTNQDEDKSNFIFLLGAEISSLTSKSSALYFYRFIYARTIAFLNHDEIIYVSLEYRACYECICRECMHY